MPLPLLVSQRMKWPAGIAALAFVGTLYWISNQFHGGIALRPPWLELDRTIPFLPWTVWVYLSVFLYLPVAFLLNRSALNLNRRLYSFAALGVASAAIFNWMPSIYPRDLYPLSPGIDPATRWLLETLRAVDRPDNCAPSLHVSTATLVALGFLDDNRRALPWMGAWALLLAVSTLTTKQHHVVDVASGLLFGALFYVLFHRVLRYSGETA